MAGNPDGIVTIDDELKTLQFTPPRRAWTSNACAGR